MRKLIKNLLFERLGALTLPVAFPNVPFSPPSDGKYFIPNFMPNTSDRLVIDPNGTHRVYGLLQVTVVWPLDDGEDRAYDKASEVEGLFPCDLQLGTLPRVRITKAPDVAGVITQERSIYLPVTVEWETFI